MTIRIVVADDHPIVRAGIVGMLEDEDDLEVVGEAGNGEEAVALAAALSPDVVLMDLRMPVLDGVGATQQIAGARAAAGTGPRVMVLTTYETDADILRAVEAGATGYLLKDTPVDELLRGVRAAARGETVLAPSVVSRLVGSVRTTSERLTPRESEVLALVAEGKTNAEVARALFVSEATIKTHLIRVFNKLGVDDRTGAVTEARRQGWIS
ncbi:MAG: response regulator transcription factor [Promicromonosporaceae bacterium]|nr:response regulator transcription factor [Promicromonosporaceae bacterium]